MNTMRKLYDVIIEEYGERKCWISELAKKLGICDRDANYLTYKMGYRRGRSLTIISYTEFANDIGVQTIFKKIKQLKNMDIQ